MDARYYDKDWNPLPKDEFAALQRDLVSTPRWVIDGNYASSLPIRLAAEDTVIFLDLPARTCPAGHRTAQAERLNIRPGSIVLTIARTYRTSERRVETADLVMPVERYALVYEVPVQ